MKNRRDFIGQGIKAALMFTAGQHWLTSTYGSVKNNSKLKVVNPYEGINWSSVQHIPSATHVHITNQEKLDKIVNQFKLRHIPISNYYPSAPYYPADSIRENQFIVKQDFQVMYNSDTTKKGRARWEDAKSMKGPFDWNNIMSNKNSGWASTLPEEQRKQLPFKLGGKVFPNIPKDVIISPNAEHHSFTNTSLHANAIGSMYSSGTFDARNRFGTYDHGYNYGTGLPWQDVFKKMIEQLLFADAGGVTINHPVWSSLSFEDVCRMLDFDERVLGIEVFNDTCYTAFGDPTKGWALKLWDQVLATKRRCLGFFVPDHTVGLGRNILLVSKFDEHECLRAYRRGAFYGAIQGSGLAFDKIDLQGNILQVAINKPGRIRVVADSGEPTVIDQRNLSFQIPLNPDGSAKISYLRIEASDESSEQIFSQPIYFS